VLLVGFGVVAWGSPAGAFGGEHGVLRIHGPGSVYAGSNAVVTLVTSPGGTVSFPFEVKNTGADTAQYNFRVSDIGCGGPCAATHIVTAGSLVVTKLSDGPNGYFTAPIGAGKLAMYTLKVTMPKTAAPNAYDVLVVNMYDTAGNFLDSEAVVALVKATTGTRADDEFVNGASQPTVSGYPRSGNTIVTSPTVAVGGKATFTVKLANDSAAPSVIHWHLSEFNGCPAYFSVTVKAGTLDVTTRALNGTYATPTLAPKASKILTVTIINTAFALGCLGGAWDEWQAQTNGGDETAYLGVPLTP
jgi:hypothetical protein